MSSPKGWTLSQAPRQLIRPDGVTLALTGSEYKLLRMLHVARGAPVSRLALQDLLGGARTRAGSRAVDVKVSYLRAKLRGLGQPEAIRSVRGVGYRLVMWLGEAH